MLKIKKICSLSAFLTIFSNLGHAMHPLTIQNMDEMEKLKTKFGLPLQKQTFEERQRAVTDLKNRLGVEKFSSQSFLEPQKIKQNPLLEEEPLSKLAALCRSSSNLWDLKQENLKTKMQEISGGELSTKASIFCREIEQFKTSSPYRNIDINSHEFIQKLLTNFQKILSEKGLDSTTVHKDVFSVIDQKFKLWIQTINTQDTSLKLPEGYGLKEFLEKSGYQITSLQGFSSPLRGARRVPLNTNAPALAARMSSVVGQNQQIQPLLAGRMSSVVGQNQQIQPLMDRRSLFSDTINDSIPIFSRDQYHHERPENETAVFSRTSIHLSQPDIQRSESSLSNNPRGMMKDSVTRSDFSGSSFSVSSRLFHATRDMSHDPERERVVSNRIGSNAFIRNDSPHTSPSAKAHKNEGISRSSSSPSEFSHVAQKGNVQSNNAIQQSSVRNDQQTPERSHQKDSMNRPENSSNLSKVERSRTEKATGPNGNKLERSVQKKEKGNSNLKSKKVENSTNKNRQKALENQKIASPQAVVEDEQAQNIIREKKKREASNEISSTQDEILPSSFKNPIASPQTIVEDEQTQNIIRGKKKREASNRISSTQEEIIPSSFKREASNKISSTQDEILPSSFKREASNEISSTQDEILPSSFKNPIASPNEVTTGPSAFEENNLSAINAITIFQQA